MREKLYISTVFIVGRTERRPGADVELNLNDPDSIIAWWRVLPDQHESYLAHVHQARPQFRSAIKEAQRRIATNPALSELLARAVQQRRQGEAFRAEVEGNVPAYELRRRELAAA